MARQGPQENILVGQGIVKHSANTPEPILTIFSWPVHIYRGNSWPIPRGWTESVWPRSATEYCYKSSLSWKAAVSTTMEARVYITN